MKARLYRFVDVILAVLGIIGVMIATTGLFFPDHM